MFEKTLINLQNYKRDCLLRNQKARAGIAGAVILAVIAIIVITSQVPTITSNINTAQSDANISVIPGGSALLGILGLLFLAIGLFYMLRRG